MIAESNSDTHITEADIVTIDEMEEEELDDLPFGAIKLSTDGTILSFNQWEQKLSGRERQSVLGRNFFEDIAPCTNVREFAGRFREGIAAGHLHAQFPYRFDYKMAPRDVLVTLVYHGSRDHAWVFVRDRGRAA